MTRLDRVDTMQAIVWGVREGVIELGTSSGRFDIPHELLYDAVRQGVRDAVLQLANAGDMSCEDLFDWVRKREANGA